MNEERRKVIAVVEDLVPHRDIAFPSVRAWIKGPEDVEMYNLQAAFPTQGEVFLHLSACNDVHPNRNQVGLFECIRSKGGHTAHWEVATTRKTLAKVIDYPFRTYGEQWLNFWRWLMSHREDDGDSVLLGENLIYAHRGHSEVIGPFSVASDGALVSRDPTFVFHDVQLIRFDVSSRRYGFLETDFLPPGKPFMTDLREAILRRLRILHRTHQLDWLSRDKVQALATAAANAAAAQGSEWVNENLLETLGAVCTSGQADEAIINTILAVPGLAVSVEAAWKAKHPSQVRKATEELAKFAAQLANLKTEHKRIEDEITSLTKQKVNTEADVERVTSELESKKNDAAKLFDQELKRLARSPATLAVLSAWGASGDNAGRAKVSINEQARGNEEKVSNFQEAFRFNYRGCGLAPISASELGKVSVAAVNAGQCLSFQSAFADVMANAAAAAWAELPIIVADVPAGVLDAIDWRPLLPASEKIALILQGVNRSDVSLVLGSIRLPLLRQALGIQRMQMVVLFTLESRPELSVDADVPLGPIISDTVLSFDGAKPSSQMSSYRYDELAAENILPMSREEFATELGEALSELPMLSRSSADSIYRRAYAALRGLGVDNTEGRRLLFKYWCLPRLPSESIHRILKSYKGDWGRDELLTKLAASEPE